MKIKAGTPSIYGAGINIQLTGEEVATAIHAYLVARGIHISGARTITVNKELCKEGNIYIDPSGYFIDKKGRKWCGRTGKRSDK